MKKNGVFYRYRKNAMQGATLLEVLVSVFLLTFGVLGLMAAQLRSVVVVSDSENQTYAAQAAENLAEAMQMNPTVTNDGRTYSYYQLGNNMKTINKTQAPATCNVESTESATPNQSNNPCAFYGNGKTKKQIADVHLAEFEYILMQMPNVTNLAYTICNDNPKDVKKPSSMTNAECTGGEKVMIKIAWESIPNNDPNKDPVLHTYQLEVPK